MDFFATQHENSILARSFGAIEEDGGQDELRDLESRSAERTYVMVVAPLHRPEPLLAASPVFNGADDILTPVSCTADAMHTTTNTDRLGVCLQRPCEVSYEELPDAPDELLLRGRWWQVRQCLRLGISAAR